ncbi:MAG: hypothetical protein C0610_17125 [Desulfobacteraceae bacterium]|nr:MAG: hypothetical protein C0610_17125 [Desulfobacteraceae bacterium]
MGVYVYRIPAKFRKMTTGEEVHELKFVQKIGRYNRELRDSHIDERLVCFGFAQAEPVYLMQAGSNLWTDSNEGRYKFYGFMLRTGKNRFELVQRDFRPFESQAYELVESKGREDGGHYSWGNGSLVRHYTKYTDDTYYFSLHGEGSSDGPVMWSKQFRAGSGVSYQVVVRRVREILVELYAKSDELSLKEAS